MTAPDQLFDEFAAEKPGGSRNKVTGHAEITICQRIDSSWARARPLGDPPLNAPSSRDGTLLPRASRVQPGTDTQVPESFDKIFYEIIRVLDARRQTDERV